MKDKVILSLIALGLLFFASIFTLKIVYGEKKNKQTASSFNYSDANKLIFVDEESRSFKITLKSNPTTGFLWFLLKIDRILVKPVKRVYHKGEFVEGDRPKLGTAGYEEWYFKIDKTAFDVPGVTKVTFLHMRPSEDVRSEEEKTFTILWH